MFLPSFTVLFSNSCPPPEWLQRPTAQGQCHRSIGRSVRATMYNVLQGEKSLLWHQSHPTSHYLICLKIHEGLRVSGRSSQSVASWSSYVLRMCCPTRFRPVMTKVSKGGGWIFLFLLSAYYKALYPSLCSALYSIGGLLMCFVWQPQSNSLFVAVTDYTTLFCFDSTRHRYCRSLRRRKVSCRGIYTDYFIVSKETTLGIAVLDAWSPYIEGQWPRLSHHHRG